LPGGTHTSNIRDTFAKTSCFVNSEAAIHAKFAKTSRSEVFLEFGGVVGKPLKIGRRFGIEAR